MFAICHLNEINLSDGGHYSHTLKNPSQAEKLELGFWMPYEEPSEEKGDAEEDEGGTATQLVRDHAHHQGANQLTDVAQAGCIGRGEHNGIGTIQ